MACRLTEQPKRVELGKFLQNLTRPDKALHHVITTNRMQRTHLEQHGIADRVFDLYSQRIFSLAVFDGKRMDLSNYDYVFAANHLAGVANRVKEKHATQRDRRMWTFYALQALTGLYEQRFKKYFEIPLVAVL